MNLASYTEALKSAESESVVSKLSQVIVCRESGEFRRFHLSVHTRYESPDFRDLIVASVDHEGNITESKWIQEQIQKIGEVV